MKKEGNDTLFVFVECGLTDTLACITGGIAEAFYGMPPELQQETLKRLPEDLWAAYDLFRQNLKRKM